MADGNRDLKDTAALRGHTLQHYGQPVKCNSGGEGAVLQRLFLSGCSDSGLRGK